MRPAGYASGGSVLLMKADSTMSNHGRPGSAPLLAHHPSRVKLRFGTPRPSRENLLNSFRQKNIQYDISSLRRRLLRPLGRPARPLL